MAERYRKKNNPEYQINKFVMEIASKQTNYFLVGFTLGIVSMVAILLLVLLIAGF